MKKSNSAPGNFPNFVELIIAAMIGLCVITMSAYSSTNIDRPNIIFVTADQMRAQAQGYMGNQDVITPNLDQLASQGIVFSNAISTFPVCTPARAMWLTGRYPTSTGVISNDIRLSAEETTIAEILKNNGYRTGYIGKWHLDGPERQGFTPPGPRRQGFDFWAAVNICHRYFKAFYYLDKPEKIYIDGFQPDHETDLAIKFLEEHKDDRFFLNLHWSTPHDPYQAPEEFLSMYDPEKIELRENVIHCVSENIHDATREQIAAYYAAITNLDWNMGRLLKALEEFNLSENTILIFTSDHGDMLYSLGLQFKQWPYEESIRVPLIIRYPAKTKAGSVSDALIGTVDLMPTILSLCGVDIPVNVEGLDFSKTILGKKGPDPDATLIMSVQPCGRNMDRTGVQPWRGVRTNRYTFVRFKNEDWCLFDNVKDPYQRRSMLTVDYNKPEVIKLRNNLNDELQKLLNQIGDPFEAPTFPKVRWR